MIQLIKDIGELSYFNGNSWICNLQFCQLEQKIEGPMPYRVSYNGKMFRTADFKAAIEFIAEKFL